MLPMVNSVRSGRPIVFRALVGLLDGNGGKHLVEQNCSPPGWEGEEKRTRRPDLHCLPLEHSSSM